MKFGAHVVATFKDIQFSIVFTVFIEDVFIHHNDYLF